MMKFQYLSEFIWEKRDIMMRVAVLLIAFGVGIRACFKFFFVRVFRVSPYDTQAKVVVKESLSRKQTLTSQIIALFYGYHR